MKRSPGWWRSSRVLVGNIVLFLTVIAAFALIARLVRNPALIDDDLPIYLPIEPTTVRLGERAPLGPLSFRVESVGWIASSGFGDDDRLSSRADPLSGRDYLVVELIVENRGDAEADVRYQGQGRPLDVRASARRPQPTLFSPLQPRDIEIITGRAPFPNGSLAPGQTVAGPLVFALEPSRRQLGLLLLPSEPGLAPIEILLPPGR
jgi:hypothetical protein